MDSSIRLLSLIMMFLRFVQAVCISNLLAFIVELSSFRCLNMSEFVYLFIW